MNIFSIQDFLTTALAFQYSLFQCHVLFHSHISFYDSLAQVSNNIFKKGRQFCFVVDLGGVWKYYITGWSAVYAHGMSSFRHALTVTASLQEKLSALAAQLLIHISLQSHHIWLFLKVFLLVDMKVNVYTRGSSCNCSINIIEEGKILLVKINCGVKPRDHIYPHIFIACFTWRKSVEFHFTIYSNTLLMPVI